MTSPLSPVLLLSIFSLTAQADTPEVSKAEGWADGASNAIHFTENKGQILRTDGNAAPYVRFALERGDARIFLLESGIAWQFNRMHYPDGYQELMDERTGSLEQHEKLDQLRKEVRLETYRMDMTLVGANTHTQVTTEGRSEDYTNYYNHDVLDVHHYRKVTYHDVYPGIDWVVYTTEKGMKYDFVVHPGADPDQIRLEYAHQEELYVDEQAGLVLGNRLGRFTEARPISYQNGVEVATRFDLKGSTLSFDIGHYGPEETLIIDPDLIWATYYGGTQLDEVYSCHTDVNGNVYLAGLTQSPEAIAQGGHQNMFGYASDAFLVKFNANGVRQWATYYGGFADERAFTCTTDTQGNVFMAGNTRSPSGIASGGHQNTLGDPEHNDAFLVKFSSTGARQWATYYGGDDTDGAISCATNAAGEIYLGGYATSMSAIADGGHQNSFGGGERDGFLAKFNGNGVRQWASYYGGEDFDYVESCCTDVSGNVYLTGFAKSSTGIASNGHQNVYGGVRDGFLAKFNAGGVRQWATYYGGEGDDWGYSCAADGWGNVYLGGSTESTTGIALNGFQNELASGQDAFVVKFDSNGTRTWATYYGGEGGETGYSCALDNEGYVYLSGSTSSTTSVAYEGHQMVIGGWFDGFLAKLDGGTVGIVEHAPRHLEVAPNPTTSSVLIVLMDFSDECQLVLHNASGQVIRSVAVRNGETSITLDLRAEEAGVYFVEIRSANGGRSFERIVKQ